MSSGAGARTASAGGSAQPAAQPSSSSSSTSLGGLIASGRVGPGASRGRRLTADESAEVDQAFFLFDSDGAGTVDARELQVALRALGCEQARARDVRALLAAYGHPPHAALDLQAFRDLVSPVVAARDATEEIARAFRFFDAEAKGSLNVRDLRRIAAELGDTTTTEEEMQAMISEFDLDGDGAVQPGEFFQIMSLAYD